MALDDSISLVYLIFWEIARFFKVKCDRLKKTNICRCDVWGPELGEAPRPASVGLSTPMKLHCSCLWTLFTPVLLSVNAIKLQAALYTVLKSSLTHAYYYELTTVNQCLAVKINSSHRWRR
jgi:hypothetical protein